MCQKQFVNIEELELYLDNLKKEGYEFWISDYKIDYGESDFIHVENIDFKDIGISEILKNKT